MISVKCTLFGRVRLDLSTGQQLTLKGKKGPALFAYLAVSSNHSEQRDVLVKLLWPRSSNDSGRASLRQTMSELRRQFSAVGLDLLQSHPDNIDIVVLNTQQLSSDVREFRRWSDQSGFNACEALLKSYGGEFMQGFESRDSNFMHWLQEQRDSYKDDILRQFKLLPFSFDEAPSRERICRLALRVLELDPACEQAYQQMMRAEFAAGDESVAIMHYQKCRAVLADKYKIEPSEEIEALYNEILQSRAKQTQSIGVAQKIPVGIPRLSRKSTTLAVLAMDFHGDNDSLGTLFSEIGAELSIALNKFKWISILSKASTVRLQSNDLAPELMREMDVHYVLTGSVRAFGSSVIINVDLADIVSNTTAWSERFETTNENIVNGFENTVARIACRVDVQLREIEIRRVLALDSVQLSAPELTFLGIRHLHDMTQASFETSYQMFQRAIDQNPAYSSAYSWLSYWEIFYVGQRWANDDYLVSSPKGELTRAAIRHDPEDALALAISGHFQAFLHRNFDAALDHFGRSLTLNPYSAFAWMLSSATYSYIGEPEEAIKRLDKAQDLCPIEPHFEYLYSSARCVAFVFAEDYTQSVKWGRRSVSDNPTFSNGIKQLLIGLGHLEQKSEAEVYLEKLLELEPTFCIDEFVKRYPAKNKADLQRMADGLRLAGVPEW